MLVARYIVNGLVATAVHFAILTFNLEVVHMASAGLANFVAALCAISVSFMGSRHFVFRAAHAPAMRQAVRNRSLNHLRHLQVQQKSAVYVEALSEPTEYADADTQAGELQDAVRSAIDALPPRTREVFLMSRERNLRYSEIAEQLGVTVKAVEANMSRALRQLREKLSPFLPGAGE